MVVSIMLELHKQVWWGPTVVRTANLADQANDLFSYRASNNNN